ncbi:MAG: helix-turn-helix transcriptional regulator [Blautia sp.]|nr:helix-turn-helix transcriptional regulator [Blautia sp.]
MAQHKNLEHKSLYDDERIDQLGTVVKKLRISLGLTQADVAQALRVTPGYISNVENNRAAMSLRVLIYYAELTHTSLDTLVGLTQVDYRPTALDNDIMRAIAPMPRQKKEKLLQTILLWG